MNVKSLYIFGFLAALVPASGFAVAKSEPIVIRDCSSEEAAYEDASQNYQDALADYQTCEASRRRDRLVLACDRYARLCMTRSCASESRNLVTAQQAQSDALQALLICQGQMSPSNSDSVSPDQR